MEKTEVKEVGFAGVVAKSVRINFEQEDTVNFADVLKTYQENAGDMLRGFVMKFGVVGGSYSPVAFIVLYNNFIYANEGKTVAGDVLGTAWGQGDGILDTGDAVNITDGNGTGVRVKAINKWDAETVWEEVVNINKPVEENQEVEEVPEAPAKVVKKVRITF